MAGFDTESERQNEQAIAVALQYGEARPNTPAIKASGKGVLAEQILQLAFDHGVKVREDADLAQILSEVEIDCPVPLEALAAVSEILTYLYKSQNDQQPELSESNEQ